LSGERAMKKICGAAVGIVTNVQDPEGHGRVQVEFPGLGSAGDAQWARVVRTSTGVSRESFFVPQVSDKVLVVFESGDPRLPIVIGSLWSTADKPPESRESASRIPRPTRHQRKSSVAKRKG
jgi:uncharacterized protein involved in type VI secretion and phage assembly